MSKMDKKTCAVSKMDKKTFDGQPAFHHKQSLGAEKVDCEKQIKREVAVKRATRGSLRTSLIGASALAVAGIGLVFGASTAARAQTTLDPLHGFGVCTGVNCTNSSVTPITQNLPTNFGFTASSGAFTGDYLIDILVPDLAGNNLLSFTVKTTTGGTSNTSTVSEAATLVTAPGTQPWTSGALTTFLGITITGGDDNNITAWLPTTQLLDPSATGYYVYQADLGQNTSVPTLVE
jgi:hypothetical protein